MKCNIRGARIGLALFSTRSATFEWLYGECAYSRDICGTLIVLIVGSESHTERPLTRRGQQLHRSTGVQLGEYWIVDLQEEDKGAGYPHTTARQSPDRKGQGLYLLPYVGHGDLAFGSRAW